MDEWRFSPSFSDSSRFALCMKRLWKQEGFCNIPKRCSKFGFISHLWNVEIDFFFSARMFHSFFFFSSLSWPRVNTSSPHCPGNAGLRSPGLGSVAPCVPWKSQLFPGTFLGQHKQQAHDSAVLLWAGKYWFYRASPTELFPWATAPQSALSPQKNSIYCVDESMGCQEILSGRCKNGIGLNEGILGAVLGSLWCLWCFPEAPTLCDLLWKMSSMPGFPFLARGVVISEVSRVVFHGF